MVKMNGTTIYSLPSASLPRLKKPTMPDEQRRKLLDMHKASSANAGIYVTIVLVVYVVLLTILLCRYVRRQRYVDYDENPTGQLNISRRQLRRLKELLCCHETSASSGGSEFPLRNVKSIDTSKLNVDPQQDLVSV